MFGPRVCVPNITRLSAIAGGAQSMYDFKCLITNVQGGISVRVCVSLMYMYGAGSFSRLFFFAE